MKYEGRGVVWVGECGMKYEEGRGVVWVVWVGGA